MTFGETLKQLLECSGVKPSFLASALDYDPSYISRWINNKKLPSLRNNEELFEFIAQTIVKKSTVPSRQRLIDRYNEEDFTNVTKRITAELSDAYYQAQADLRLPTQSPNAVFMSADVASEHSKLFADAILRFAAENQTALVNLYTSTPLSIYGTQDAGFWESILSHPKIHQKIQVVAHQLIHMSDFEENINIYCSTICSFADYEEGLTYEFYEVDSHSGMHDAHYTYVEDSLLSLQVNNPFSHAKNLLITTDRTTLTPDRIAIQRKLPLLQKMLRYTSLKELSLGHFLYDYVMDGEIRYFLNIMHPIYMSEELAAEIKEQYFPEMPEDVFEIQHNSLCANTQKDVLIYRSALLEYLYSGKIYLFGEAFEIEKKYRIRHLNELLRNIEEGKCHLRVLDDNNPLLSSQETKLSFYLSRNSGFAVSQANKENIILFTSHRTVEHFRTFFKNIESLDPRYILEGAYVTDFITRGLQLI